MPFLCNRSHLRPDYVVADRFVFVCQAKCTDDISLKFVLIPVTSYFDRSWVNYLIKRLQQNNEIIV